MYGVRQHSKVKGTTNSANFILAVEGCWGVGVLGCWGFEVFTSFECGMSWVQNEGEVKTKVFLKSLSRQHLSFKNGFLMHCQEIYKRKHFPGLIQSGTYTRKISSAHPAKRQALNQRFYPACIWVMRARQYL